MVEGQLNQCLTLNPNNYEPYKEKQLYPFINCFV